ncbi:MAG: hypothetical protein IKT79_06240 [Akkermansia sp.]|nr:hypothetical protein [Akkermansia sp.]
MRVYVNNAEVSIFAGATAQDAVRRYSTDAGIPLPEGELYDVYGNVIASDSPMSEGRRIFTHYPF